MLSAQYMGRSFTTPGMDIGSGTTSLDVSSFVPGLTPFTPYKYQVVASNALGTVYGKVLYGDRNQRPYLFSGSKTNITLPLGTYIITVYGAPGGYRNNPIRRHVLGGYVPGRS